MSTIRVNAEFNLTATETFSATEAPAAGGQPQVQHSGFNRSVGALTASTTPPVTIASYQTLTGPSGTIDLTALPVMVGTANGTAKKLRAIRIYNPNATGNFVIQEGASNGYGILNPITVPPGGVAQVYFHDGLGAVGASDKTLDWTGTAAHTYQLSLILG